jgi:large subunit ribosomal protein L21
MNTEKTMFAVIKTGGKQYKVAANDKITVMTLKGEPGDVVSFDSVLALFDGETSHVGAPHVAGASVAGAIVSHERGAKVIAFKKRRRKNSRRKRGHKQDLTIVQITDILTGGAKPARRTRAATAPAALMSEPTNAHHAAESAAKAAGLDTKKFQRLEKPFGAPDNLEWIHGIGPGIAEKLHGIGVYHFWQVAALLPQDIAAIEHEVGFSGRAERDHWKDQARDLMAGKPPVPKTTGHHQHEDHA